jgi:hypothetical protein
MVVGVKAEPFGRWLLAQRDRGDWIDDLRYGGACTSTMLPSLGNPRSTRAANDEEAVAERLAEDLWKNRDGRP